MKKHLYFMMLGVATFISCTNTGKEARVPSSEEIATDFMNEEPEAFNARMQWWRDAGLGMFIHWGAYAVPGEIYKGEETEGTGEWIMNNAKIPVQDYEEFVKQFNPVDFNADEWVSLAKDAGMQYIVITSKHHDGFCLWDSEVSMYDIMDASPFKRDILAELKEACEKDGIKLCFYHSIMDWHHPDAQAPHYPDYNTRDKSNPQFDLYRTLYLKPQIKELVQKYQPYVLWYDGEWIPEWTHEDGIDLYNFTRSFKPDILVNNRVDKGRRGMQGMNAEDQHYAGDFGTPEQEILEGTASFDWESCMTMNDTWGFRKTDDHWKSSELLIHNIVDIAAKGGNYLLNVGPTPEGRIPEPSIERLREIGEWMSVNGEVVYQSRGTKHFREGDNTRFIQSADGNSLYAVSLGWPGESFTFSSIKPGEGEKVYMLGVEQPLEWAYNETRGTTVTIPTDLQEPANRPCRYAFVFKMKGEIVSP